jgi:regulator of sigma E protease
MHILIYGAAFLGAIGVLVSVHEFGHYWVAKKLGFKVQRFSVGFGKALLTRTGAAPDYTEYCLSAIPLGGYVKLLDDRVDEVAAFEAHRSFTRRPVSHRIAVLVAGPLMNFVLAIAFFAIISAMGVEVVKPVVESVEAGSPAARAGLVAGDEIVEIRGIPTRNAEALDAITLDAQGFAEVIPVRVRHEGVEHRYTVTPDKSRLIGEMMPILPALGVELKTWSAQVSVKSVLPQSAGAKIGLHVGDRLVAVDGKAARNAYDFTNRVNTRTGAALTLAIVRDGKALTLNVPAATPVIEHGKPSGRLGVMLEESERSWPAGLVQTLKAGPLEAVSDGAKITWAIVHETGRMVWGMIAGTVSTKNLSGVVSIVQYAGKSAAIGLAAYLSFLASLSVSLGVMNLLPIPLLDGGQIVFALLEGIKGSPISMRLQIYAQQVGVVLLGLLMSFSIYNDLANHWR